MSRAPNAAFAPIALDTLETVTGGYHDPVPSAPSTTQPSIAVGERHPPSIGDRLNKIVDQFGPMIRCFTR